MPETSSRVAAHHGKPYYIGLGIMGLLYIAAGINHFRSPGFYIPSVPPYIPAPAAIVAISGVTEILGGIGVLIPISRRFSAWGLAAMLVAFLPVHINMCLHPSQFATVPLWLIWLRLPLQIPLILWAWYYSRH